MKKILITGITLIALTSCNGIGILKNDENKTPTSSGEVISIEKTNSYTESTENTTGTKNTATGSGTENTDGIVKDGSLVSVYYTLRVDNQGEKEVKDTNVEAVAKENNLYKTGAKYEPLPVLIGSNQVVKGFEEGLMGMKKGEKKSIVVPAEKGYGKDTITQTIDAKQIAPEFTIKKERKILEDTITDTLTFEDALFKSLPTEIQEKIKSAKAGEKIDLQGKEATVKEKTDTSITFEVNNLGNPFLGKEKKVGTKVETPQADFMIKELTDTGVTLLITNKTSPFYQKDFKEGATATVQ